MFRSARPDPEWRPRPEDLPDAREIASIPRLADLATNPFFHRLNRLSPPRIREGGVAQAHAIRLVGLLSYLAALAWAVAHPESWAGENARQIFAMGFLGSFFLPLLAPIPSILAPWGDNWHLIARLADRGLSLTRLRAEDAAAALIAIRRPPRGFAFRRRSCGYSIALAAAIAFHLAVLGELREIPASAALIPAIFAGYLGFELGIGRDLEVARLRVHARGRLRAGFHAMPLPDLFLLIASCTPLIAAWLLVGMELSLANAIPGTRRVLPFVQNLHLHLRPSLALGAALLFAVVGWAMARAHVRLAKRGAAAAFDLLAARIEPLVFVPHEPDPARPVPEPIRRWRRQVAWSWVVLGIVVALVLAAGVRARTRSGRLARAMARGMTGGPSGGYVVRASDGLDDDQLHFLRRGEVEAVEAMLSHPVRFDDLLADFRHPGAGRLRTLRVAGIAPDRFGDALLPSLETLDLDFLPGALDLAAIRDPTRAPNLRTVVLGGGATLADPAPLLESRRPLRVVISLPGVADANRFLGDSGVESVSFFRCPDLVEGIVRSGESVDRVGFISCPRLRRVAYERGPRVLGVARSPLLREIVVDARGADAKSPLRDLRILENPLVERVAILGASGLERLEITRCPALVRLEIEGAASLATAEIEECDALGDFAAADFAGALVEIDTALVRAIEWALSPNPPAAFRP